jgi:type II secretory pathway component PulF
MSLRLFIARMAFNASRVDLYESLIDKLDRSAAGTVERLDEIFCQWRDRDRKRSDMRAPALVYIEQQLSLGAPLSSALRAFIPPDECLILKSGEMKGDLASALKLVVRNARANEEMRSVAAGALFEPGLIFLGLLATSVIFGITMWPKTLMVTPLEFWPAWTHACIQVNLWTAENWPVLPLVAVIYFGYRYSLPRWKGVWRARADRIPPFSMYRGLQASSFLGVLAALLESGRQIREALVIMQESSSPYMAWRIQQIIRRIDIDGGAGVTALNTGLFSTQVMDRIEDSSTNRTFGDALRFIGDNALRLILRAMKQQAAAAYVILMLIGGSGLLYSTAVVALGAQQATEAQTDSMGVRL